MHVILCDGCKRQLEPADIYAVFVPDLDGWLVLLHMTRPTYLPRATGHACSHDCIGKAAAAPGEPTVRDFRTS